MENFRAFACGPDPFGRMWNIALKWMQTAISIRHSDSVDAKFILECDDETQQKIITMPHLALRNLARESGVVMSDAWCTRLAKQHLQYLILSGEDMEKDMIQPSGQQLETYARAEKVWASAQVRDRRGAA